MLAMFTSLLGLALIALTDGPRAARVRVPIVVALLACGVVTVAVRFRPPTATERRADLRVYRACNAIANQLRDRYDALVSPQFHQFAPGARWFDSLVEAAAPLCVDEPRSCIELMPAATARNIQIVQQAFETGDRCADQLARHEVRP